MHVVNMTCQINAQMGAQVGKNNKKKYDIGSMVCVDNKGRIQEGEVQKMNIKIFVCAY